MNVLLTSVGANSSVVRSFRAATARRGGRLLAADHDSMAPALRAADGWIRLPPANDRDYLATILEAVEAHDLQAVVPMGDDELALLSSAGTELAARSCRVAVATPAFVTLAADKFATVEWCGAHGFRTPATWPISALAVDELPERLFVRPRHGSGSRGARSITRDALRRELDAGNRFNDHLIQEELRRPEVTIDALLDDDGALVHFVPRLRLVVEAGRSIRAMTVGRAELDAWATRLFDDLGRAGGRGLVSVQAFVGRGDPLVIEVNARAANGLPLTIAAGGDHPEWLLQVLEGRTPDATIGHYVRGLHMAAAFEPVFCEELPWS